MPTNTTSRRGRPPHPREAGATYLVSWELHPTQAPLSEAERGMVLGSIRHFDGVKFTLLAALVLEDRVYVLVIPYPEQSLERLIGGWKRWASRLFRLGGRTAPLWRRGYLDRITQNLAELDRRIRQLRELPGRRWPGTGEYGGLWIMQEVERTKTVDHLPE